MVRYLLFLKLILVFILVNLNVFADVNGPEEPTEPEEPTIEDNENKTNNEIEKQTLYGFSGTVHLKKGSKTKGNILLKNKNIVIFNKKDDFVFKKSIPFNEISSIEIKKWSYKKGKINKPYISYTFYPNEYLIILKDGKKVNYKNRIEILEDFIITNDWGEATVYSIFIDYWIKDKKSGKWFNSKKRSFKYNEKNPNPKTVVKIDFDDTEPFEIKVDK